MSVLGGRGGVWESVLGEGVKVYVEEEREERGRWVFFFGGERRA